MTLLRFDGRVALVTGAGRGLGRAYAQLLAARGARVVVNDIDDAAAAAAEIVAAGGEAVADAHSVAEYGSAAAAVGTALDTWDRLDILVNNAGVYLAKRFDDTIPAEVERVLAVHLLGTIWTCRSAWEVMREQRYGRIVNIVSSTIFGRSNRAVYGAAKGGILALGRTLALEGEEHGIAVNAVAPGAATAAALETAELDEQRLARFRASTPEQVAPLVAYLAHEDCALTGRWLHASGGRFAEAWVEQTAGYATVAPTIEDIHDHLTAILEHATCSPR